MQKDAPLKSTKISLKLSSKENRSNSQESKRTNAKSKLDKDDYKITAKITEKKK